MDAPAEALLQRLGRLVIQDEAGPDGLGAAELDLALLLVWQSLPEGQARRRPWAASSGSGL